MPTFSQLFLANLGTGGGMLQGFSALGGAIGGIGGQIKEKRRQDALLGYDTTTPEGRLGLATAKLKFAKTAEERLELGKEIQAIREEMQKKTAIAGMGLDADLQNLVNTGALTPAGARSEQARRRTQGREVRSKVNLMNALEKIGEGEAAQQLMRGEIGESHATTLLANNIRNTGEGRLRKKQLVAEFGEEKANEIINDLGSIARLGALDNAAYNASFKDEKNNKIKNTFIEKYGKEHPGIMEMLEDDFITVSDAAKLVQDEQNNEYTLKDFKKYVSNDGKRTEVRGGFVSPKKGSDYFAIIVDGEPIRANADDYVLPSDEEKGAAAPTVKELRQAGTFLLKEIGAEAKEDTDIGADFGVLELLIANRVKELMNKNRKMNYADAAAIVIKDLNIKYNKTDNPFADNTLEYKEDPVYTDENPPVIETQEEYDKLPKGTLFIEDGVPQRKD